MRRQPYSRWHVYVTIQHPDGVPVRQHNFESHLSSAGFTRHVLCHRALVSYGEA